MFMKAGDQDILHLAAQWPVFNFMIDIGGPQSIFLSEASQLRTGLPDSLPCGCSLLSQLSWSFFPLCVIHTCTFTSLSSLACLLLVIYQRWPMWTSSDIQLWHEKGRFFNEGLCFSISLPKIIICLKQPS